MKWSVVNLKLTRGQICVLGSNRLTMYDTRLSTYFTNPTFSWEYDALNRMTKETYPNSDYIEWTYNAIRQRVYLFSRSDAATAVIIKCSSLKVIEDAIFKSHRIA